MNAARLLALYERIAEAPDAVARLRRFVLDLAVRGKLVPQDAADEPAAELLKRIARERARLVKAGEIKAERPVPPSGSVAFRLPSGWSETSLSELAVCLDYRRKPINATEREKRIEGKEPEELFPYYGATQQQGWIDAYLFDEELVLLGEDGVPFFDQLRPKAYLISGKTWVNNHAHVFKGILILNAFLLHYLNVFDYAGRVAGATRSKLNQARAVDIPVALPPLAEQHRIVAKVDELMALCDRLEAARTAREATRDRLAAASLARLNTPDPETFLADARFALDALPALTTRPDQIKHLRQTILNLAVRGKLVLQDSSDEPAAALIKRTPAPPRPARFDSRSPELIPGDCGLSINDPRSALPRGWEWVPLIRIARLESGHTPSRNRPDWWGGDVPWIGLVDARLHNNGVIHETLQATNPEGLANSAARLLPKGTVCFSRTASVGYVVIMGRPMATSQDFVNWVPTEAIASEWLQLVMIAERPAIGRFSKGAVHQTIYYPAWLSMHIALPPLAEQRRIVVKVNELVALCDALEASLAAATTARTRLLEATLVEALSPADGQVRDAAA
jgi:type I restriction enzyme S subunit